MKKIITSVVIGLLFFSGIVLAQSVELPPAGILPGNPLFFIERFFEDLEMFFTFDEVNKTRRLITFTEERLAEVKILSDRGDGDNVERALELYKKQFLQVQKKAERLQNEEVLTRVIEATSKHFTTLEAIIERVPEQAKDSVNQALENSKQGQIIALRVLYDVNIDRATEVGVNISREIVAQMKEYATEKRVEILTQKLQHLEKLFYSFVVAPQGRADIAAKFSERMTETINKLDEVKDEVEDVGIGGDEMERLRNIKVMIINEQLISLKEVVGDNPAKAVEIYAQAVESRLNAVKRNLEEQNEAAIEKNLKDYNKYIEFGQIISAMSEDIRVDETTIEDLVKEATLHHLRILEDVRQKLPPQAQQEFQRAQDATRKIQELQPIIPVPTRPEIPQTPIQRQPIQSDQIPLVPIQPPRIQPEVEQEIEMEQRIPQQIPVRPRPLLPQPIPTPEGRL
jgi:hypothetical protein